MRKGLLVAVTLLFIFSIPMHARTVRVGYYEDTPIVFKNDQGEPDGLYAILLNHIADEQGWELIWVYDTFSACMGMLDRGEIDLMTAIAFTPERNLKYNYNREAFFTNWGVLMLPEQTPDTSINDMQYERVTMMDRDAYAIAFLDLTESFDILIRPVYADSYIEAMEMVQKGDAEAAVVSRISGRVFGEEYGLHPSTVNFHPVPLRLAAPKGRSGDLLQTVDDNLRSWRGENGSLYFRTVEEVMSQNGAIANAHLPSWLRWLATFGVFMLAGAVGLLIYMRFQNIRKTERLTEKDREIEVEKAYRQRAERESYTSQVYYGDIIESMREGFIITDAEFRITYANASLLKLLGYTAAQLIGTSVFDIILEIDRDQIDAELDEIIHGKASSYELRLKPRSGDVVRVIASPKGFFTESEVYRGLFVLVHDLTEIEMTRSELDRQRAYFLQLFQYAPEAIVLTDSNGVVSRVNPGFEAIFGFSKEEVIGRNIDDLIVPEDCMDEARAITDLIASHQLQNWSVSRRRKDGEMIDIIFIGYPIMHNNELINFFGMYQDVTERRRMEMEMIRSQKLEDLSVLAGGIAHDFNNILTAVIGNISLAKIFAEESQETLSKIENAEKAAMQAKDLTYQLLTFAKGGEPICASTDLGGILRETSSFSLAGSNVKCTLQIPDDLPRVNVDSGQISQVIQNLIINADQAMPNGGRIDIRAREVVIITGQHMHLTPGKYIELRVKDTGTGIPPEILSRIFDPYFSTKKTGSGLGLATTYSIMKKHMGHIEVDSIVDQGAVFHLWLPVEDSAMEEAASHSVRRYGAGEKVLVMDDEEIVLDTVCEFLTHLRYTAEQARDGEEAIEKYVNAMESGEPFAAVILDITIPGGMGGQECLAALKKIDPDVKGVVSSGYSNDRVLADYLKYDFVARLNKPYEIDDLGEVLFKVLRCDV